MSTLESETERTNTPLLSVSGLHVSYDKIKAIQGIDFEFEKGSFTAIIGPNGAGKSTLADTISGFKQYEQGSIHYKGLEVSGVSSNELVENGLVYCTESKDLFPYMDVYDNLELGTFSRDVDLDERFKFVFELFPKLEERQNQIARTMSGGEQQMLAIGRALMGDPDCLLLDEPSLGLAPVVMKDISHGMDQIQKAGVTTLLFEQNVTFALDHADYIYLMENGRLEREGTPDMVRNDKHLQSAFIGE